MWSTTGDLSPDEIEQQLIACESGVAALRARQAELLVEAERRQMPRTDGCRTLSEWAVGRMDVSTGTARSLVSTGRRLEQLPYLAKTLAAGEVSFDRAELVSKLATPDDEIDVLEDSRRWDLPGLVRRVGLRRRISREDERESARHQSLMFQHSFDGGLTRLWGELPGSEGWLVEQKLMAIADTFPPLPDGTRPPLGNRMASALVAICGERPDEGTGDGEDTAEPIVTVTVDGEVAAEIGGEAGVAVSAGPRIGIQMLEEMLCLGLVELNVHTSDGKILGIGDTSRVIPPRIRRAVMARDGGCVSAGCTSRYRMQVHHIRERSRGGTHDPANLVTLCWYHHHVVIHGYGCRIDPTSPSGGRRLLAPISDRAPPWGPHQAAVA